LEENNQTKKGIKMNKLIITLASLWMLSTGAMAVEVTSRSVTVSTENSHNDTFNRCGPVIGNWINSAETHCMLQGSGPSDTTQTFTVRETPPPKDCENEPKDDDTDDDTETTL
jgi:hypothetical protein